MQPERESMRLEKRCILNIGRNRAGSLPEGAAKGASQPREARFFIIAARNLVDIL